MDNLPNNRLKVGGDSLIFLLDDKGLLKLINKSVEYSISSDLSENIVFFDVFFQKATSNIRIGAVTEKDSKYNVYLTDIIDSSNISWKSFNFSNMFKSLPLLDESTKISLVTLNLKSVAITTIESGKAYYYILDGKSWIKYDIGEESSEIQSISFGKVYGRDGLFLDYLIGNTNTVLFQSFYSSTGRTSTYRYSSDSNKIKKMYVLSEGNADSNLYLLWDKGVFYFKNPDTPRSLILVPESGYVTTDFCADIDTMNLSTFCLSNKDNQFSDDKTTKYKLNYENQIFSNLDLSFVLK
jgi:hypothetical protein